MFLYVYVYAIIPVGWGSSFEPIGCRCDAVCYRIAGEAMVVEPDDPWLLGGVTPHGVEPDDPSMLDRPQLGGRLDGRRLRCLPDGARCAETMRHFGSVLQDPIMERILQPPILLDMRQQLDRHWPMLDVLDGCKSHGRNPKTMEKDPVQVQRAAGVVWQWLSDDGVEFSAFFSCCLTVPFYSIPYYAKFADNVHRCATGIKAMTMTKVEYQSLMVGWLCFGGRVVPLLADSTLDLSVADRDCRHPIISGAPSVAGPVTADDSRQSRGAIHAHCMVWVDPSDSVQ